MCIRPKMNLRQFDKKIFIHIIEEKMKNFPFDKAKERFGSICGIILLLIVH